MASKKNSDKDIAKKIEQQMRWEMTQQKKKRRNNIIAVLVCSVIVVGLVATMAIAIFPIASNNNATQTTTTDDSKDEPTTSDDSKLTPANDNITTDDGLPKVSFKESDAKDGSKIQIPSLEMPSNYKAPTKLESKVLENGDGAEVKKTDKISAYYTGWFPNKDQFDSSYDRGEPTSFGLNQVIPGWTNGLTGKHVGDTVELVIPWADGYGEAGTTGIPGKADLIFVVKIVDIVKE